MIVGCSRVFRLVEAEKTGPSRACSGDPFEDVDAALAEAFGTPEVAAFADPRKRRAREKRTASKASCRSPVTPLPFAPLSDECSRSRPFLALTHRTADGVAPSACGGKPDVRLALFNSSLD